MPKRKASWILDQEEKAHYSVHNRYGYYRVMAKWLYKHHTSHLPWEIWEKIAQHAHTPYEPNYYHSSSES